MRAITTRRVRFGVSVCFILFAWHAAAKQAEGQARAAHTHFLGPQQTNAGPQPTTPAAQPSDVTSVPAILSAMYDALSGAKGAAPDWGRFRSLFAPGARLIPVLKRQDGNIRTRPFTVDEFITAVGNSWWVEQGFFERSAADRIDNFANMAIVLSVYELRRDRADAKPYLRGVNSFQLLNDGKRWWIVTLVWQAEDAANPIPQKYLSAKK